MNLMRKRVLKWSSIKTKSTEKPFPTKTILKTLLEKLEACKMPKQCQRKGILNLTSTYYIKMLTHNFILDAFLFKTFYHFIFNIN